MAYPIIPPMQLEFSKKSIFYDVIQWCGTNKGKGKEKINIGILVPLWMWAHSPYIDYVYSWCKIRCVAFILEGGHQNYSHELK